MDSKTLLERLDAMAATRHGGDINELLADLRPVLEKLATQEDHVGPGPMETLFEPHDDPALPTLAEWEADAACNALRFCEEQGWGFRKAGGNFGVYPTVLWYYGASWSAAIRVACEATGTPLPWREPEPEWQPPETVEGCKAYIVNHPCFKSVRVEHGGDPWVWVDLRFNPPVRLPALELDDGTKVPVTTTGIGHKTHGNGDELAMWQDVCRWVHEQEARDE